MDTKRRPVTLIFVALAMCALDSEARLAQNEHPNQTLFLGFDLPIGLPSNEVQIVAVKPCRLGETFSVSCKVSRKITQCLWEVNGVLKMSPAPRVTESALSKGTWECGVEVEATKDSHGSWMCKIWTESGSEVVQQAETTVSVISLPRISLRPQTVRTTITAGEETQVTCVVNDARPVPNVVWKIGDIEVDSKDYEVITQVGQNRKATMNSILKRRFIPEENNKTLQCIAEADWLRMEDNAAAQTTLDIQFPPMPQNDMTMTLYSFEENKPGEVRVTVHANPRPHSAFWILPTRSNDKLKVEEKLVDVAPVANYIGLSDKDNVNDTYTYRLLINSVQQTDANPGIKFQVFNMVGTSDRAEQYVIRVVVHQPAKTVNPPFGDDFRSTERFDSWSQYLCPLAVGSTVFLVCYISLRNTMEKKVMSTI